MGWDDSRISTSVLDRKNKAFLGKPEPRLAQAKGRTLDLNPTGLAGRPELGFLKRLGYPGLPEFQILGSAGKGFGRIFPKGNFLGPEAHFLGPKEGLPGAWERNLLSGWNFGIFSETKGPTPGAETGENQPNFREKKGGRNRGPFGLKTAGWLGCSLWAETQGSWENPRGNWGERLCAPGGQKTGFGTRQNQGKPPQGDLEFPRPRVFNFGFPGI